MTPKPLPLSRKPNLSSVDTAYLKPLFLITGLKTLRYKHFANKYNFAHTTISPRYPKSGGLHEKMVQTVKHILEKCRVTHQDSYLALLDYRNTPIDGVTPAQALMSRRLRSSIPISQKRLQPETINHNQFQHNRIQQQQKQKKYFDKNSKSLCPLKKEDTVRFKKDPTSPWIPATVIAKHDTVNIGEIGSTCVRHRIHHLICPLRLNSTSQTHLKQT